MKTITISLYNRPEYTQQVLNALLKCDGIDEYNITIRAEPESDDKTKEVINIARSFKHKNAQLIINHKRLRCSGNIFSCMNHAFIQTSTRFNIHFEDDIVPSKDCLRYYEWCDKYFYDQKNIGVVTSYQKNRTILKEDIPNVSQFVSKTLWFTPWGWATWRDRWTNIIGPQLYDLITNRSIAYASWDKHVHDILTKEKLSQVFPFVSRTQNIGALNGVHCPGPEFHKKRQWTHLFADDCNVFEKDFVENNMLLDPWIQEKS